MQIFVGTSGWMYGWNPDGFDWYLKHSGLNAVELNASFYRFPFKNQVKSWARKNKIRWAIKVNRFITHVFQLSERARGTWQKFFKLFQPLDNQIDFYLFQLPPHHSIKMREKVSEFAKFTGLGERFALEVRNDSWFNEKGLEKWAEKNNITLVSVDAPDFRKYYCTNGIIYLRMHGRTAWYAHCYTKRELEDVADKLLDKKPERIYVFFNNDHDMLNNGRLMFSILHEKI